MAAESQPRQRYGQQPNNADTKATLRLQQQSNTVAQTVFGKCIVTRIWEHAFCNVAVVWMHVYSLKFGLE